MIYLRIKNKIKRRTPKWLELLAASDCINIRRNWLSIRVTVARRGIIYFYIFFCRPPHTIPLEMLMKSDKLQNYIPREMFFFLSPAYTKVLTLANEGLLAKGVGGSTHQDAYSHLATDLFLFFAPFLQYARPPPPPGVSKLQGNTPRAPTLIYSNLPSLFKVSSAVCISLV